MIDHLPETETPERLAGHDEIAREADCFHKVLHNPRNIGLTRMLNRLIRAMEDEEFIFRMDAGDVSLPNRFACQVRLL